MSGLYQRALEIYRQTVGLRLVPKGEPAPSIEEVSPTEREKILHQIDEVVSRSRMRLGPEAFRISPRRSGVGLPLLINGLALTVVVVAVVVSSVLLNRQEQALAAEGGSILSAESKLIETLRQESQRELAQKDRAILEAQGRLAEVSQERERLRSETADAIRRREEELAAELALTLEAERARLQAQGLSTATVDQRLASFEADRRAELDRQAEAFRLQIEQETARREQAIAQLSGQYEQTLRQAQEERAGLEKDLQARQVELQQQIRQQSEQTQSLERERAATAAELVRLQEAQARQSLVLDQLLTMYDTVNRQVAAGQDAQALQSLGALRAYFDQEPARSLPGIQRRRPVEMFLIGSLEELIQARQNRQEQQKTVTVLEAGARLDALRQAVQRAEERFQAGDYAAARELYLAALAEVPEAARGQERLTRLAELERERTRRGALELAARGGESYQAGQWQGTLDRYRQALVVLLGDQALAGRLVEQVAEAGYQLELASVRSSLSVTSDGDTGPLVAAAEARAQQAEAQTQAAESRATAAKAETQAAAARAQAAEAKAAAAEARAAQSEARSAEAEKAARAAEARASAAETAAAQARAAAQAADARAAEAAARSQAAEASTAERGSQVAQQEARRQTLRDRLAMLQAQYAGQRTAEATSSPDPETVATLLQAKLLVWQIIASEPVSSQYPQLYDTMQRYFDVYGEQRLVEGRYSTLKDVSVILDALNSAAGGAPPGLSETWRRYSHTDRDDLLSQLLRQLELLLR